jgi:hypothetical protein
MRWKSRLASICENLERQELDLPAVPFSIHRGRYFADSGRAKKATAG